MKQEKPQAHPHIATVVDIRAWLYSMLLTAFHWLVAAVEWLYITIMSTLSHLSQRSGTPPTLSAIAADGRRLQKRPDHLGVVVVEPHICWQTLADLILWSLAYGIRHVSVYDRAGRVRAAAETRLRPMLERRRRHWFGDAPARVQIVGDDAGTGAGGVGSRAEADGCDAEDDAGDGAGCVRVLLLREGDGLPDIVAAARRLCGEVAAGDRPARSIDRHMLGAQLLPAAAGWPDPALVLKLGQLRALMGYLPWQLRLTEVLDAPAYRPLPYQQFRRMLVAYGGIQQRMGT